MFKCTPVYHENFNSTADIVINQGGTSCFAGSQKIITKNGSVRIDGLLSSDEVLSYNEHTKNNQWSKVKNIFRFKNHKPTVRVNLKNGTQIVATEDHKFYFEGDWVILKDLLSLLDGNMDRHTKI